MNDKDIMRMMSEVGIEAVDPRRDTAQLLLESWILSAGKQIADAAQAEMKERCAKVCEEMDAEHDTACDCMDAIYALGEEK